MICHDCGCDLYFDEPSRLWVHAETLGIDALSLERDRIRDTKEFFPRQPTREEKALWLGRVYK